MTEYLSKYAAKQRAKAEGKWVAPVAVAVAVSVTSAASQEGETIFAPLGRLPELCAGHIAAARACLQKAASVAAEMERIAAAGIQKQEPKGLHGACHTMANRLKSLAKRAGMIPNGESQE